MKFLRFLEGIRTPFFDTVFGLITHLGEETVFLAVAIAVFWCINKREGFYLLITGLVGTVVNQALKLICKIPRPWKDPTFTAVESAMPEATGYSFPSGHTQNVTGTFGSIARWSKRRVVRAVMITLVVLVAFSRMYLGVHTPYDVGFSLIFGAALVFLLYPLFKTEERFRKFMPYIVAASALISLIHLLFVFLMPSGDVDSENLASGMENAATLFGCTAGLIPVYIIDRRLIDFKTEAAWYSQIIKLAVGLALVLLIKEGMKMPLGFVFGNEYVARGVRYFLVVMFAGSVWPMTFGFFSRLKITFLDNLFKKNKIE
ncbi:MAG: phosphatase PAP2 family protein [Ruminococcaceae bacterium]|nr:phosphatase PAP2 family protein [Oscillospiraceae bacterium]